MFSKFGKFIRRQPVTGFFLLAFGISWTCLLIAYIILQNNLFLAWIGSFGPAIAALIATGICSRKIGLMQMLARLVRWRVPWPSYPFVIGIPILLVAGTVLLHDGPTEMLNALRMIIRQLPLLLGLLLLMVLPVMGEEIGWRGFALPRLQDRLGPWKASLLIGLLWGIWHIPAALDPANVLNRGPLLLTIPLFTLGTMGFSVVYTWLWNYTGGSLLIISLFHGFYNNLNLIASVTYPYIIDQHWLYLAVLAVILAGLAIVNVNLGAHPRHYFRKGVRDGNL
jgi:membrane protease YdiL (CAAX protease family)